MSAVLAERVELADQTDSVHLAGPGERLRLARQSKSLDIRKVAQDLRLSTSVVRAIEQDDYAAVQSRVFLKGYIKKYARLMALPEQEIIERFDSLYPPEMGVYKPSLSQIEPLQKQTKSDHTLVRITTWLIVIALAALFVIWWRGYLQWPKASGLQDNIAAAETVEAIDSAEPEVIVEDDAQTLEAANLSVFPAQSEAKEAQDSGADSNEKSAQLKLTEALVETDEVATPEVGTETNLPSAVFKSVEEPAKRLVVRTEEAVSTQSEKIERPENQDIDSDESPVQKVSLTTKPAAQSQPTETQLKPEVADAPKQVVIQFNDNCWVDIRGQERSFRIFGEIQAGTTRTFGGKPPYKMVLGNAKAVDVKIDDQIVDLTPYVRGNVARLTLNPADF